VLHLKAALAARLQNHEWARLCMQRLQVMRCKSRSDVRVGLASLMLPPPCSPPPMVVIIDRCGSPPPTLRLAPSAFPRAAAPNVGTGGRGARARHMIGPTPPRPVPACRASLHHVLPPRPSTPHAPSHRRAAQHVEVAEPGHRSEVEAARRCRPRVTGASTHSRFSPPTLAH
jgi:hypothetical protein